MKISHLDEAVGRIVQGVNTTVDVGVNQTAIEASKFGNKVDKDGKPPTLSSKVKGKPTNVLFNLGLAEDKFTAMELALMEGGHEVPDRPVKKMSSIMQELASYELSEALGELDPSTEIYVDMDGVLADFFGEWAKVMGKKSFRDIEDPASAIKKIKTVDNFWLNLPMLPQAKELLMLIKKVKGSYNICSSPLADDPRSEPHKKAWIKKHLDFFPPKNIHITHNKPQYAKNANGTSNILIDDYGVNINAWEAAGGIGFKYKDHKFERTAKAIKQHMQEPVEEKWSAKYKRSINCSNPKGFSQKAHCAGRKKNEDIEENFADGKKKGKSRPGRVKRAGASCNGSVTDLRKRAKNSSGEKARMYHWCANMKSGRKKK